jgi:hypothetical protein
MTKNANMHVHFLRQGVCGEEALAVSLQDAVLSRYPSTLINLSSSPEPCVQVSSPPHLHRPRCHATRRHELTTLWHGSFSDYPTRHVLGELLLKAYL